MIIQIMKVLSLLDYSAPLVALSFFLQHCSFSRLLQFPDPKEQDCFLAYTKETTTVQVIKEKKLKLKLIIYIHIFLKKLKTLKDKIEFK